jgi:hypothetical protein
MVEVGVVDVLHQDQVHLNTAEVVEVVLVVQVVAEAHQLLVMVVME